MEPIYINSYAATLARENETLRSKLDEIQHFCAIQIDVVMTDIVKQAVKEIRLSSKTKDNYLQFLGDHYIFLNFFEQLCLVYSMGDQGIYPGVENYISNLSIALYKELLPSSRFFLDTYYDTEDVTVKIENKIGHFLTNYENAKIRKAYDTYC